MANNDRAIKVWQRVVVFVANRDTLAEGKSSETQDSGQPGGSIRRLLRYLRNTKAGMDESEVPITHITREREGD